MERNFSISISCSASPPPSTQRPFFRRSSNFFVMWRPPLPFRGEGTSSSVAAKRQRRRWKWEREGRRRRRRRDRAGRILSSPNCWGGAFGRNSAAYSYANASGPPAGGRGGSEPEVEGEGHLRPGQPNGGEERDFSDTLPPYLNTALGMGEKNGLPLPAPKSTEIGAGWEARDTEPVSRIYTVYTPSPLPPPAHAV